MSRITIAASSGELGFVITSIVATWDAPSSEETKVSPLRARSGLNRRSITVNWLGDGTMCLPSTSNMTAQVLGREALAAQPENPNPTEQTKIRTAIEVLIGMLCPRSQISPTGRLHDSCTSTRHDRCQRWLWRVVGGGAHHGL
jgi:hypothetical protein